MIHELCWDSEMNRLIPKRNLKWLCDKHNDLYNIISESFPNTKKIPIIYAYLKNGINCEDDIPLCSVCGENKIIYSRAKKTLLEYCSNKCSIKSESVQKKIHDTCIKRYGKRFNIEHRESYELGEHYTHRHLKNIEDVNDPILMNRLADSGHWLNVANHFNLTTNSHSSAYRFMRKYGYEIRQTIKSTPEIEVVDFIMGLGVKFETKCRNIIKPYELDIYIPDYNLAIEFNGLFWHSSGDIKDDVEYRNKHLMKTNMCESLGINLLHIFENEWHDPIKRDIWKSVIKHKLGLNEKIYARKCVKKKIDVVVANEFCANNHLQGSTQASFAYGLYIDDDLVMVATFAKSRYSNYDYELIRMCTIRDMCVVGGASRLLNIEELVERTCVSYGNRRWCNKLNNIYDKIGIYDHDSEPCYWYVKHYKVSHRSSFMKHKLASKLKEFDPNMTEVQNMYNNGYRRIWDCGNLVYVIKSPNYNT